MLWMFLTFSSYAFDFIATCERVSFAMHDEEAGEKKNDQKASEEHFERKHLLDASKT